MHDCFYFRPPLSNLPSHNQTKDGFICRPERLRSPPINQTTYSVAEINNIAVLTGGISKYLWVLHTVITSLLRAMCYWWSACIYSIAGCLATDGTNVSGSISSFLSFFRWIFGEFDDVMFCVTLKSIKYVAGGMVNAQTRLDSVERWCPNTNKWETVASLPVPLSSLCLVACTGHLYAIGKHNSVLFSST